VEYRVPGVVQVPVQPKAGLTFATALRAILRHDPDVVLVGEMRDRETAETAVQAALTGHLVFSTLHTTDAAGGVARLADMGVERYLIAATVQGILAQRLVRLLCEACAAEGAPGARRSTRSARWPATRRARRRGARALAARRGVPGLRGERLPGANGRLRAADAHRGDARRGGRRRAAGELRARARREGLVPLGRRRARLARAGVPRSTRCCAWRTSTTRARRVRFRYRAATADGVEVGGALDARSPAAALEELRRRALVPIALDAAATRRPRPARWRPTAPPARAPWRCSRARWRRCWRRACRSSARSRSAARQAAHPAVAAAAADVRQAVRGGSALAPALARARRAVRPPRAGAARRGRGGRRAPRRRGAAGRPPGRGAGAARPGAGARCSTRR
jgi:hypothetical protein